MFSQKNEDEILNIPGFPFRLSDVEQGSEALMVFELLIFYLGKLQNPPDNKKCLQVIKFIYSEKATKFAKSSPYF